MARKNATAKNDFVLFDVLYEDGTQSSNRKVAAELLGSFDGDEPAEAEILRQDAEIAARSGKPRPAVKSVARVKKKKQTSRVS